MTKVIKYNYTRLDKIYEDLKKNNKPIVILSMTPHGEDEMEIETFITEQAPFTVPDIVEVLHEIYTDEQAPQGTTIH